MAILEVKDLKKTYGKGDTTVTALDGVSFSVEKGESVGRALINDPAFILADEPTGNLDSKSGKEIIELLKLSNKKYNQTLIIITHDDKIASQADRVIAISDGRIIRDEEVRR